MSTLTTLLEQPLSPGPHGSHLLEERQKADFEVFQAQGFPTKKTERWKYTSCQKLLSTAFSPSNTTLTKKSTVSQITVLDGVLYLPDDLPESVVITDVFQGLQQFPDLLAKSKHPDAFSLLNISLLQGGVFIHVPKGVVLEKAIEIHFNHSDACSSHHLHNLYLVDEEAQVSITEVYQSASANPYFHNVATTIQAKKRSRVHYHKLVLEGEAAFHIGTTYIEQAKASQVSCHTFAFGSAMVRSDVEVFLREPEAHCDLFGLSFAKNAEHVDTHTSLNHLCPHATSTEVYKSIVGDSAKVVFDGNIFVEKGADKTHASLVNKNILLSKQASVDTKPQLEIFADDVKCAHGTTVGQLDSKALFYLTSRGISEQEAKCMLIDAFAKDVTEKLHDSELKERLLNRLQQQLRTVG